MSEPLSPEEVAADEEALTEAPEEAMERSFKCDQCGAKLIFHPGSHNQTCPYCGHMNPIPDSAETVAELDFLTHLREMERDAPTEERLTVKCQACGAESTFDPNVTAHQCAFCAADIVATTRANRQLLPQALLPFRLDQAQAREHFRKWIGRLWFAPGELTRLAQVEGRFKGAYIPNWTYDSETETYYTGQRGDNYTVTEHYTTMVNGKSVTRTRQRTKIRWRHVSGRVRRSFDDVLVLASRSLPWKYTQALAPWDLENLVPYQDEYLSGFVAECYQIDLADGFRLAREIMADVIRRDVCRDIGGDHQRIHKMDTTHDDVTFKHILLPIWINAYQYRNKSYRILVNARTGKVQGERPWSWVKITFFVLFVLIVLGLGGWLISVYAQNNGGGAPMPRFHMGMAPVMLAPAWAGLTAWWKRRGRRH